MRRAFGLMSLREIPCSCRAMITEPFFAGVFFFFMLSITGYVFTSGNQLQIVLPVYELPGCVGICLQPLFGVSCPISSHSRIVFLPVPQRDRFLRNSGY